MYRSLRNIVKYKFNGIVGRHKYDFNCKIMNEIDVFAIESMRWRKRFFMINNRDHPFTLSVVYIPSRVTYGSMPIIGSYMKTRHFTHYWKLTLRYKTLAELEYDVNKIIELKTDTIAKVTKMLQ